MVVRGVRASLGLLTRIPVGGFEVWPTYSAAWFWIPGLLAGIIWYFSYQVLGSTGAGMIGAIGGEAILTGAVHWRGFAKTVDGWTSRRAERNSDRRRFGIGVAGVLFMALALLALWTLWINAGALGPGVWLLPPLWGRAVLAWGTTWRRVDVSSPRASKFFRETHRGTGAWITLLIALVIGVYILGFEAVGVFGATLIVSGLFVWWGSRLFRGLNEDVLWACVIVAEVVALYILALTAPPAFF